MLEFVVTLIMLTVTGFVVGVSVLISNEVPQIATFIKTRPVLGWTAAFFSGGIVTLALIFLLELSAIAVLRLLTR